MRRGGAAHDRQRKIVSRLERDGHDVTASKQLLDQFHQLHGLHVADRDRLEKNSVGLQFSAQR
jgi:hypothetical protein